MTKCECGKEFKNDQALRGHKMTCKAGKVDKVKELEDRLKALEKENSDLKKVEKEQPKELKEKVNYFQYKELPPPIVDHLEKNFGNWLNFMEIGQEWKEDFGGYGLFIKVPQEFSTEWKTEQRTKYSNKTRKPMLDKDGNTKTERFVIPDVRWKSLNDLSKAVQWLILVKEHIIKNAYKKGLSLPNTNTQLEKTTQTLEDYKKATHA